MSILPGQILNSCVKFAQALLPQHCLLCGAWSGKAQVCEACRANLPYHAAPACPICAAAMPEENICGRCLQRPPAFDRTLAAFSYAFPLDALIRSFKYSGNLALARVLAEPLARLAARQPRPDALIPLPLHASRLRERGFNQSMEIARIVSNELGIPLLTDACERVRATAPQTSLHWKKRAGNIRGAFACGADLRGKKIAVVDDVMTTGATLDEFSRVLRKAGAAEVGAWVVARTTPL